MACTSPSLRLNLIQHHLLSSPNPSISFPSINKDVFFSQYFSSSASQLIFLRNKALKSGVFSHSAESSDSYDTQRGTTLKQILSIYDPSEITYEKDMSDPIYKLGIMYVYAEYDKSITTRILVHAVLFIDTLQNLGTEKHLNSIRRSYSLEDYGCFAMTELGHGSNVLALETTATYMHSSQEFVINSPTATSAKWWIGAASKTANVAVVFAQLIVNGENKGVHAFLVPIRDKNHQPCKGVVLGDCGPKVSMDRIDNGFILFSNYHVGYDCLLDRFSFITADGKFKSTIKNSEKRFAAMLGGLIRGRLAVISSSEIILRTALTISLRYSNAKEVIQDQKRKKMLGQTYCYTKLVPILSNLLGIRCSLRKLLNMYEQNATIYREDPESEELAEMHALLSGYKVCGSWICMESLQIIIELCGEFSLYDSSSLIRLRNNHDINTTWEGDNTVLIQQVGKFVLKNVQKTFKGQSITSTTLSKLIISNKEFLSMKSSINGETITEKELMKALKYRFNYFLNKTVERLQEKASSSESMGAAWNNSQAFYIQDLGKTFAEYSMAKESWAFTEEISKTSEPTSQTLKGFSSLFCISRILGSLGVLQESFLSADQVKKLRSYYILLCESLRENCLDIIESVAPPDELLGSDIGSSAGNLYDRILEKAK